jgi:hypothetical protein
VAERVVPRAHLGIGEHVVGRITATTVPAGASLSMTPTASWWAGSNG